MKSLVPLNTQPPGRGRGIIITFSNFPSHSVSMPRYRRTRYDFLPNDRLITILNQYHYYSYNPYSCGNYVFGDTYKDIDIILRILSQGGVDISQI